MRTAADNPPEEKTSSGASKELDRTLTFSDGVFAIAITLLAFNIDSPQTNELLPGESLARLLWLRLPDFFSFALSFFVIGSYWITHHSIFRHIRRYDQALLWLNLALLFCIAFLPYPTVLLGNHTGQLTAVVFYAACQSVTGIAQFLLWKYAADHRRLIPENLDPHLIQFIYLRTIVNPAIFLISLPVAYFSLYAAQILWGGVFILTAAMAWWYPHYKRLASR